MPFSTSWMPARTFSEVTRFILPSSSSSPQSPQVEPVGRCFHRFVTSALLVVSRRCSVPTGWSNLDAQLRAPCEDFLETPTKGTAHARQALCRLRGRTHSRTTRSFQDAPAQTFARPRRLGRGLRDRATRRGRGPGLPPAAHAWLRGLDYLALPPDRWANARGRPRDDHRGSRVRRGRRRGHAS